MPRRLVIALLQPVGWSPPRIDPAAWRAALAEDVVDLIATLSEVDTAIAVPAGDRDLGEAVAWPGMPVYELPPSLGGAGGAVPTSLGAAGGILVAPVLACAAADGYDQAAVLVPDAPDLPGLLVGKLMRPLTTRTAVAAPATSPTGDPGGSVDESAPGLLGVATRLPVPDWFPDIDLDGGSVAALRAAAPHPADVASAPGWRRLRTPAALATLNPALEGWDRTRSLWLEA